MLWDRSVLAADGTVFRVHRTVLVALGTVLIAHAVVLRVHGTVPRCSDYGKG